MSDTTLNIRRAIMRLAVNESKTVRPVDISCDDYKAEAMRYAKVKRIGLSVVINGDAVTMTRLIEVQKPSLYPEIDRLEVGRSHLFELGPALHQRIRLAASNRSRQGLMRLTCTREGDAIRVTRLPITEDEAVSCGPIAAPERTTRWGLERLADTRELRFEVERKDQGKLRLAATRKAMMTGWTIRCRLQDDGTMLVYRTDAGAPTAQQAPT